MIFIVQGRVRFEDLLQVKPSGLARLSVLRALTLGVQAVVSLKRHKYDAATRLQSPARLVSRTFGAGESFALLGDVFERELKGVSWTHHDRIVIMPARTCWTIEVRKPDDLARSWPQTGECSFDVVLAEKSTRSLNFR